MADSMSNSFALLGANDGFQQVPSKKNRKKKNKAQDQIQAVEASFTPSSAPSDVSEDVAGAPHEAFQQVCGKWCRGMTKSALSITVAPCAISRGRPWHL